MISREKIESALRALNAAENDRVNTSVEATSARIDAIMARDVEGWRNGVHCPNRDAEREVEKKAFGALVDYNRQFELMIIEPPLAAITWTIRGTFNGQAIAAPGCSNFEFNEDGTVKRYWMYFNPADFSYRN
ncbi:nuclear transport factor 2 family protein [Sphingomonas sp. HITSZ_GF]|uniref:nuclear transport factor 2 family protein n=1 Tax=Sphingomonas sp. HITSZ_GF TaxID=3037247 RepID=UPI00240E926A|nr:nuclear transport factor 2 family protein [Sphingomonas sp. HITSZ_GF]MDG2533867.1 nuclear transport factor 2 family protein [Sphingomonas sp. HITSZ_GF]